MIASPCDFQSSGGAGMISHIVEQAESEYMTTLDASIIRTDDGTEIPFAWAYPGADAYEWARDTEHWRNPLTPMERWLHEHWANGIDRAWDEAGMEPPAMFYRFQCVGPFLYSRESPYEPDRMMRMVLRYREVSREHGGALRFWLEYCRPRVERVAHQLAGSNGDMPLAEVAELWAYGFHQTFTSLAVLFEASMRVRAMLTEAAGEDAELLALEVTQGADNPTQGIDAEIWQLAELARETPDIRHALEAAADAGVLESLRSDRAGGPFIAAFDALIGRHGSRSLGWELTQPTWRERPEAPLALVRAYLTSKAVSPAEMSARSDARRHEAIQRALALVPAAQHEAFSKDLARLEGMVRIREDRAYWQMVLAGEVRTLLLRIGAGLVASGRIERADDVLFLEPSEVEDAAPLDLRDLVSERRRAWARWLDVVPPAVIGAAGAPQDATTAEQAAASASDEVNAATGLTLRGVAASRGVVTGPARIIQTPDEGAARLRSGDILVCVASTPAWTPLFAIIAGIISETGGALSHPAITAREYGIPAVVAVKDVTAKIRDGQQVTIDGSAGTIMLGG